MYSFQVYDPKHIPDDFKFVDTITLHRTVTTTRTIVTRALLFTVAVTILLVLINVCSSL